VSEPCLLTHCAASSTTPSPSPCLNQVPCAPGARLSASARSCADSTRGAGAAAAAAAALPPAPAPLALPGPAGAPPPAAGAGAAPGWPWLEGPGGPLPGETAPGGPLPANPLPGGPLPGEPRPGEPLPGEPRPGGPRPAPPLPADLPAGPRPPAQPPRPPRPPPGPPRLPPPRPPGLLRHASSSAKAIAGKGALKGAPQQVGQGACISYRGCSRTTYGHSARRVEGRTCPGRPAEACPAAS
jgi:hypothetical protein